MPTKTERVENHYERMNAVKRYICNHTDEPLNRRVLAEIAGFSVPQLQRIFVAAEGESIASYVRRVRLKRAAQKLRMGAVDITEVALAAGYHTHAAFGKAFKQQYGFSPSEFRALGCRRATQLLRRE
jgi:AraC family transcriptional regulator